MQLYEGVQIAEKVYAVVRFNHAMRHGRWEALDTRMASHHAEQQC